MKTEELKEYLGMVVQMEKEINLQERLSQKLQKEIQNAEWRMESIRNGQEYLSEPNPPKRKAENTSMLPTCAIITVAGVVFTIILRVIGVLLDKWDVEGVLLVIIGIPWMLGILLAGGGAALGALGTIYYLVTYPWQSHKDTKVFEAETRKYEQDYQNYQRNQKENEEKVKQINQLSVQKSVAETSKQQIESALVSSKRNLEKMYSYNIVFPKYRNYVMVSSIYEYLCAGRCKTLEGHEGAYNILELEIRLDRIITQLDRVIEELEAIRANQYMLYSCLKESNRKMDMLLQEETRIADSMQNLGTQSYEMNRRLGELQHSSELANYLAECNNRQLSYMNRMNYLAGHYENPYGNYAPV